MYIFIFLVLGLAFGFGARLPWALLAFLVPAALALAAADRSGGTIVIGFVVTAIGIAAGLALAARIDEQHA